MKSISVGDASTSGGWGHTVRLDQRFAPMMSRLESSARQNPENYQRKVVAAGFLGYAVLAGLIAILTGLAIGAGVLLFTSSGGGALKLKLLIVFGLLAFGLCRALWVSNPEPDGFSISRSQFPTLFSMIDEVRAATGGPEVHDVRIVDQLNAAITQQPRFLFFGARNTLYLGVPLLLAMTAEEVRAVVAHEFGHFVGRHGKSAGFVYRIRMRWAQVAERLPAGIVAGLLRRFFAWYGPWFAAYSFALARQQEFDADRVAAQMAGAQTSANALSRIAIQADRYGATWSGIWNGAIREPEPPTSPYGELARQFLGSSERDRASLASAVAAPADLDDTHPSLQQRLAALQSGMDVPPPLTRSAAEDFLGEELAAVLSRLDSDWHAFADPVWENEHRAGEERRAELLSLEERVNANSATSDELFSYATLMEQFEGPVPAIRAYQHALEADPDNAAARFHLGRLLLDSGDPTGISELGRAARDLPAIATAAYGLVVDFLRTHGREEEAATYLVLLQEADRADALAAEELNNINQDAVLEPLDAPTREQLIELCSQVAGVKSLHAASRPIANGERQVVFAFSAERGVDSQLLVDTLIEAMAPAGNVLGVERSVAHRWLAKKIERQAGSNLLEQFS